tara:strand:- start:395 stop:640 length:246 start_codon:yes stop_codon:yes gene_type:complete
MKWFFILMLFNQNTPVQDYLYLIQDPKFSSPRECLQFVEYNQPLIQALAAQKFPTQDLQNVYCMTQDALDELVKDRSKQNI